jgi:hypothetical protein
MDTDNTEGSSKSPGQAGGDIYARLYGGQLSGVALKSPQDEILSSQH